MTAADPVMVEPFRISVADEVLQDLSSRLATARLPRPARTTGAGE